MGATDAAHEHGVASADVGYWIRGVSRYLVDAYFEEDMSMLVPLVLAYRIYLCRETASIFLHAAS